MKVKNFRNTWCLYSVDTFKKFKEIWFDGNFRSLTELYFNRDMIIVCDDKLNVEIFNHENTKNSLKDYKQIHLVDGEFHYVSDTNVVESKEEKMEDSFNKFGFEELKDPDIVIGYLYKDKYDCLRGHELNNNTEIVWNDRGKCLTHPDCNLTPLKKEWYENPDNFPCLCWFEREYNSGIFNELKLVKSYNYNSKQNMVQNTDNECWAVERFRPATSEECLSLCIKE